MPLVPNLAGVASQELVETIGTGSYRASYINWARTFNLLHQHAPDWMLETLLTPEGGHVWRAPGNGGYLMLRFVHADGRVTPAVPQAVMDNRNNPIPYERISARDVTDTHRRGGCMAAAMIFGLAHELWAKMPLESGYLEADTETQAAPGGAFQAPTEATMQDFLEACLEKGLTPVAADTLLDLIGTNYAGGIKSLANKTSDWVTEQNEKAAEESKKSESVAAPVLKQSAKKTAKSNPEDY